MMHWNVMIAIVVCGGWALFTGHFVYTSNRMAAGRSSPAPGIFTRQFVEPFLFMWGVPVVLFAAIWGGIFWW